MNFSNKTYGDSLYFRQFSGDLEGIECALPIPVSTTATT